jgi:hypothetical protein
MSVIYIVIDTDMRAVIQIVLSYLLLGCAPAFSAVTYLATCSNWATVTWTYGPATIAQSTAGGVTGVPYCLTADGSTHVQPVFYSIDTAVLDWLLANQTAIQNVLNNQSTLAQSFDPEVAGQFFAWGFTGIMLVGIASWSAGQLLGFMHRTLG